MAQMAAIFTASSMTAVPSLPGGLSDYTGHFIGYALLGLLAVRAFAGARWRGVTARAAIKAIAFCSLYGVTDEFHQSFVPGRNPSIADWCVDTLGAAIAAVIALALARAVQRRSGNRGI